VGARFGDSDLEVVVKRKRVALLLPVVAAAAALSVAMALGEGGGAHHDRGHGVDYIAGRVTSGPGESQPQAGVWVIAETGQLGTEYSKIVVTDSRGRYVLPQLPDAQYSVWVRGYGLVDSAKVTAYPGNRHLDLQATVAPNKVAAAQIYPPNYWLSLFNPPDTSAAFASNFKLGCELCHMIGDASTRTLTSAADYSSGLMDASVMDATAVGLGKPQLVAALADWAQRIRNGATPKPPPRPSGVERNFVITEWGWGGPFTYAHDEITTDPLNPQVNARGPVYGVDLGQDHILSVNPTTNTATEIHIPTLNGFSTPWCNQTYKPLPTPSNPNPPAVPDGFGTLGCPAPGGTTDYPGVYDNPANPHNPMMDSQGRIWFTTQIRREWAQDLPSFCRTDPVILNNVHHRQLGMYDPKTGKFTLIDTCFGTHHLEFDKNGVLWMSGDSYVLGWFDPSKYDPSNPATLQNAEHWADMKVASTSSGVPDTPIVGFNYGIATDPVDGSVWTAQPGTPGRIMRYDPKSGKFETYIPPTPGSGPRGVSVDSKGHIWVNLAGSGDLAEFDRSKCPHTWGTGNQCPQGWTLYKVPGPRFRTAPGAANQAQADYSYLVWVDTKNTLGMGKNTVIDMGTGSDSLLAFSPRTEKFTIIRIPYPMATFMRGADGRIDNPTTGWKGRGLWFDNGIDPLLHSEVQQSYIAHVQLRPSPLAS
jgi:streptogramin lyase